MKARYRLDSEHRLCALACLMLGAVAPVVSGGLLRVSPARAAAQEVVGLSAFVQTPAQHAADPSVDRLIIDRLDIPQDAEGGFELDLDLDDRRVRLVLTPADVRSANFQLLLDIGTGELTAAIPPPAGTYRGHVTEDPGSAVAASLHAGEFTAVIRFSDGEIWTVEPLSTSDPAAGPGRHVLLKSSGAALDQRACGTDSRRSAEIEIETLVREDGGSGEEATVIAEIAFDADVEFFQANGGSVDATVADIEAILSAVNVIYERDLGIIHRITTIIVRTGEADPYASTESNALLDEFIAEWNANQGTIVRDVAHLMTGKQLDGNVIGVAEQQTTCLLDRAYGVSQSTFSASMAVRVAITAHELGHNWAGVHCDEDSNCAIMCSTLGQCSGDITSFSSANIPEMNTFKSTLLFFVGCLATVGPPADFDLDGDVDDLDYMEFEACLGGPDEYYPAGCEAADLNHDSHVDLRDWWLFQALFTG